MLSPNKNRIMLLPQDREIIDITGMSEEQYVFFCRQAILHSKLRPGEPVALAPLAIIAINLAIGLVLSAASALLAPKPQVRKAPDVRTRNVDGQTIVRGDQFTAKSGFDTIQNVVEIGSTIPIVYANRQLIDGKYYGGIRINTNLLWSQIYSIGGGQLLKAIFLVGESSSIDDRLAGMILDNEQFAIGNNLLNGYDLSLSTTGRLSIYYNNIGGRITSGDYIAGASPFSDIANSENEGADDVFQVKNVNGGYQPSFCFASKPSTQTSIGVYGFIGNNLGYRVNPVFRPGRQFVVRTDNEVNCKSDWQELANRAKQDKIFPGKSCLYARNGSEISGNSVQVAEKDQLSYRLLSTCALSDYPNGFTRGGNLGQATVGDVAGAVAGRQKQYDELITIGQLYKIGSALAICSNRDAQPFLSDADQTPTGGGRDMTATFTVVRSGAVDFVSLNDADNSSSRIASSTAHIMRCAIANIVTERGSRMIEIGLRSRLQLSVSGICNFRDSKPYSQIDAEACDNFLGDDADGANPVNFNSGTYTGPEMRYSFFRISYRVASSNAFFTEIGTIFGTRGATGVDVYNYIKLDFTFENRYEIRIEPLTSWEIRTGAASGDLAVLDYAVQNTQIINEGGVQIEFSGEIIPRSVDSFGVSVFYPKDGNQLALNREDSPYYVDSYAKIAEAFIYNEVTSSATQPEHEIVYVNNVSTSPIVPKYFASAIVGLNIKSSEEVKNLQQFSVYVNKGVTSTSMFPNVLYDLFTNDRYGVGKIMSSAQIDKVSFDSAADWNYSRKYFFDGAITEKQNLRTWGAQRAADFLLDLVIRNGKFALQPVANFEGSEKITQLFTSGNIIEGSFELNYFDAADRIPPRVSVKWRQERTDLGDSSKGLFPVVREVIVREAGVENFAPIESIDISDFATSERHAVDRGKWECKFRRLVTHSIKFKTTPSQASLDIGGVFKLGLETTTFNQPQNGAIAADGTITSWPPLADGNYSVLLWDGASTSITETTMSVQGGATNFSNSVFCINSGSTNVQTYKTQSLSFDEDGNIEVEAIHFPTNSNDESLIVDGFDNDSNWILEGLIN